MAESIPIVPALVGSLHERVSVRVISTLGDELERLRGLASPAIFDYLRQQRLLSFVVAAYLGEEPIGLAVAFGGAGEQVELSSLFVVPFFRRQGIGRALLSTTETFFAERGYTLCACTMSIIPDDLSRVRFLRSCGWGRPQLTLIRVRSNMTQAVQAPWLKDATLPPGFSIIPWVEVTAAQRLEVQQGGFYVAGGEVDPFATEPGCDPRTSLALLQDPKQDGETPRGTARVVGWTINHVTDARTLRWTNSWVDPRLQIRGLILPIWIETVRRQIRLTDLTDFTFVATVAQPRMARFFERRMKPWATELSYTCVVLKSLSAWDRRSVV